MTKIWHISSTKQCQTVQSVFSRILQDQNKLMLCQVKNMDHLNSETVLNSCCDMISLELISGPNDQQWSNDYQFIVILWLKFSECLFDNDC